MKRLIIALLLACTIIGLLLRLGSGGEVLRLSARELQKSGSNTGHSLTFNLQPSTLKSLLSLTFNLGPSALSNGQSSTGGTGGSSSGGIGTSTVSGQNVRSLQSIAVSPANATINAGSTEQYTATGTYSDGSQQNITGSVAWTSTNTAVATIASGGLATAVATGSTTIQATMSNITGSTGLSVTGGGSGGTPGATATQNVLAYTAANPSQCSIEVSTSASYSPVVSAVDGTKFTNANMDGQTNVGGRAFVVGQKWIAQENVSPPAVTVGGSACTYASSPDKQVTCSVTNSFTVGDNVRVTGMANTAFNDTWSRIVAASGSSLTYVLPQNTTASGTSGSGTITRADRYSLALQTNTTYYYRIGGVSNTCGASPATGSFTTMTIPNNNTFAERPIVDNSGQSLTPTILESRSFNWVDPMTGALIRRLTMYADVQHYSNGWESGYFRPCSTVSTNGGYHCLVNLGSTAGLYWINGSTGEVRWLGFMHFTYTDSGGHTSQTYVSEANVALDTNDGNVMYALSATNGFATPNKNVIIKLTYTGNDVAAAPLADAAFSVTALTPDPSNTLDDLLNAYIVDPAGTFTAARFHGCTMTMAFGNYLQFYCAANQQGSPVWNIVFNLSNNTIAAAMPSYENAICRWCGGHGGTENLSPKWNTWGTASLLELGEACPGTQTGEWDVTLTAAVDTSQTNFSVSGEPVNICPFTDGNGVQWSGLQNAATGDLFYFQDGTGERVKITNKVSSTSWTVQRGANGSTPKTHALNAPIAGYCSPYDTYHGAMWWDFIDDPHGTDTTSTYFVNGNYEIGHGWQRSPNFVNSFDVYTTAQPPVWTGNYTASELLGNQTFHLSSALTFSGLTTDAVGVAFQNYLTWDFENASFKNSYIHNLYFVGSSGYGSYALVGGTSYIYKYTFSTFTPTFEQILPYQGFQGGNYLKDISGPGSVLNDTTADNRKMCIAKFAGECRTGSSAGDVYANLTTSDSTTCNQLSENVPWLGNDWCLAQMSFYGSTLTEIGLTEGNQVGTLANGAPVTDAKNSRILLGIAMGGWRQQAAHPHVVPDGSYAMFETCITDPHMGPLGGFSTDQDNYGCHPMMALIPPQPTADGIDRTNFENVSVSIGPGSGGATHAVVTFGYEENEPTRGTTWPPTIHFYCAQYQGQCYYQSGNYGNTTLANATSLSLNSNQTLPMGVPQRVLFYQVEYLNSSNQVVATDPMQVVAIP